MNYRSIIYIDRLYCSYEFDKRELNIFLTFNVYLNFPSKQDIQNDLMFNHANIYLSIATDGQLEKTHSDMAKALQSTKQTDIMLIR